jgi:hypothetical protein
MYLQRPMMMLKSYHWMNLKVFVDSEVNRKTYSDKKW